MRYHERLQVPWLWWVLAILFALSVAVSVGFYLGLWPGLICGLVTIAVSATVFIGYGGVAVVVDAYGLRVGRSVLEWQYLGEATSLDAEQTKVRIGPEADVRAWLAVRPYLHGSVQVLVQDAADPHPYWLITSRHPKRLAKALTQGPSDGAGKEPESRR